MKRIIVLFLTILCTPFTLNAMLENVIQENLTQPITMRQDGPEVYPLTLSTSLATDNAILYRQNVKYTLINNTARPKAWSSPLQINHYSVDTEINRAATRSDTHQVDLKFAVKQGNNCIHQDRRLFIMPIGFGTHYTKDIPTDLGILKLVVAVSSLPSSDDDTDSSDDDDLE